MAWRIARRVVQAMLALIGLMVVTGGALALFVDTDRGRRALVRLFVLRSCNSSCAERLHDRAARRQSAARPRARRGVVVRDVEGAPAIKVAKLAVRWAPWRLSGARGGAAVGARRRCRGVGARAARRARQPGRAASSVTRRRERAALEVVVGRAVVRGGWSLRGAVARDRCCARSWTARRRSSIAASRCTRRICWPCTSPVPARAELNGSGRVTLDPAAAVPRLERAARAPSRRRGCAARAGAGNAAPDTRAEPIALDLAADGGPSALAVEANLEGARRRR